MKKIYLFTAALMLAATSHAVTVESVAVQQNWPWSTQLTVTYVLSGTEGGAVDITPTYFSGTVALSTPEPGAAAVKGELYNVKGDGTHTFTIEPAKAFPAYPSAIADFKVHLTATAAAANITEALYRIYDLTSGACTDVTRADLLNGKYGAYETNYAKIGEGFTTPLSDVLIWTGVTNGTLYKTEKLVMRKIPAKDVIWQSGDPAGTLKYTAELNAQYYIKLDYDYYVGVFEITQYQYYKIYGGSNGSTFAEEDDHDIRPVEYFYRYLAHSNQYPTGSKGVINTQEIVNWPTNTYLRDVGQGTFMAKLRTKTGVEFDLPTGAEWEYACGAGSELPLYSGKAQSAANVDKLGWYKDNSGEETHAVGGKAANAWGIYDMLGNVEEWVLNYSTVHKSTQGSGTLEDPYVNPEGSWSTEVTPNRMSMGGCYSNARLGYYQDLRRAFGICWHGYGERYSYLGFRVVCPVTANGQWGEHPTK